MKVELTYFKPYGGKYYSSGSYITNKEHMFEIVNEVAWLWERGELPDLIRGHSKFVVLIRVPEHPHDHPALVGIPQH